MSDYDKIDALNYSSLKQILTSPRAYQRRHMRQSTAAMSLGTAVHCALLEPERFAAEYCYRPEGIDGRTKVGKLWLAEHEHLLVAPPAVRDIVQAVSEHDTARGWLARVLTAEVPLVWTLDGRRCKGRVDGLLTDGGLLGVKTTQSLPRFAWQAVSLHYDMQWAWYYDGLCQLGRDPPVVVELVVETSEPYDCAVFIVPDEVLDRGRESYQKALEILDRAERSQNWPGAWPGDTLLVLPERSGSHDDDTITVGGIAHAL